MQLQNDSPFEVIVQVAEPRDERIAVVIVKSTFDLDPEGGGRLSAEQLPLVTSVLETDYGTFHGELFFKKEGVDLCVLGSVRRDEPVDVASVELACGPRRWHLDVFGDRSWEPGRRGRLAPGDPEPFQEMPLGFSRAFGGNCSFEDGSAALFSDNPSGRGYYLSEAQAKGQPLPNIMQPGAEPLQRWDDATPVVGWGPYPSFGGLRAAEAVEIDPETERLKWVRPCLFNHAHPDLVLDTLPTGEEIRVEGLHNEPFRVRIPDPPARVYSRIGEDVVEVTAPIDGAFLWCDDGKLVLTQRGRFTYEIREEEHRSVRVDLDVDGWS